MCESKVQSIYSACWRYGGCDQLCVTAGRVVVRKSFKEEVTAELCLKEW